MRKLLRGVLVAAVLAGLSVVVPAAPAAAALPSCNQGLWVQTSTATVPWIYLPFADLVVDCVLGVGNQGGGVVAVQNTLIKCYGQSIARDGIFGTQTRNALRNAQTLARKPITVDGVYGPQTRDAIMWPFYSTSSGLDRAYRCLWLVIRFG